MVTLSSELSAFLGFVNFSVVGPWFSVTVEIESTVTFYFRSLVSLLRELLASAVFLSAADKLSDPVSWKSTEFSGFNPSSPQGVQHI